jgi:hypothetical protein
MEVRTLQANQKPDTISIFNGGQRSRTAWASISPSAGHVDVGEEQGDILAGLQDDDGFVGIRRLQVV